jgi:tripartite-type tricarboxylate transporter receptor subunit TctC
VTALIRNDVQMGCLPGISVASQASSGAIKMLAVSTAERSKLIAELPTLKERGIDVEADAWMGMIAPAGTPQPIIDKLHREVVEILRASDIREKLAAQLMEPIGNTPAEFKAKMEADVARWAPVIKAANIRIN